jgi:hypothetical protein
MCVYIELRSSVVDPISKHRLVFLINPSLSFPWVIIQHKVSKRAVCKPLFLASRREVTGNPETPEKCRIIPATDWAEKQTGWGEYTSESQIRLLGVYVGHGRVEGDGMLP